MENRTLGRTHRQVSVVGLGCWQLGADWGDVSEADASALLHAAVDAGVTFFDTADVYGDGRSEQLIGRLLRERDQPLTVATKMGRRADPHVAEAYTLEAFRTWVDRSRTNLGVDTLDLVQMHCPPTSVFADDRVFDALDTLVAEGRAVAYGVSVETCDEALRAIARPGVASVQIILNVFRRKPLEQVFRPPLLPVSGLSRGFRWPVGCCPVSTTSAPGSPRTITATTTGMGNRSTPVRPSAGCRTTSASPRPAMSRALPRQVPRPRSWPCGGSRTKPVSRR